MSLANYVNPSGVYVGDASITTMNEYAFRADNTYLCKFVGMMGGRTYYTETTGTYTTDGKRIMVTPIKRKGGYNGDFHDEQNMLDKPATFDFFIGPNKFKEGPFLNLHKDGSYYFYSDFPYDSYTRVGDAAVIAPAQKKR